MLIQVLLIVVVGCISVYFMLHRQSMRIQAGMKLFLVIFTIAAIVSILFPDLLNAVAHRFGVGRGADLMLYGLIMTFVFTVLKNYLEFKETDILIAKLARRITLLEKQLEESQARQRGTTSEE